MGSLKPYLTPNFSGSKFQNCIVDGDDDGDKKVSKNELIDFILSNQ